MFCVLRAKLKMLWRTCSEGCMFVLAVAEDVSVPNVWYSCIIRAVVYLCFIFVILTDLLLYYCVGMFF